jgi:hypothetical protein
MFDGLAPPHVSAANDLLGVVARPTDRRGWVIVEVVGEVDRYTAPPLSTCLRTQSDGSELARHSPGRGP